MKTLLRIDSSIRRQGSHSRSLADYFEQKWLDVHPEGVVVTRDLGSSPVPHLTDQIFKSANGSDGHPLVEELIAELIAADEVLIGAPVYNFNVPSTLKAYLDHVVQHGKTFKMEEGKSSGLLSAEKSVCVLSSCGAFPVGGEDITAHRSALGQPLGFMGLTNVDFITLHGTGDEDGMLEQRVSVAYRRIEDVVLAGKQTIERAIWMGSFEVEDRREINALRSRQVDAILSGNADAYAEICVDDILLLLQGHDIVEGRADFVRCESALFEKLSFDSIEQTPLRIERQGDLVVEIGLQRISVAKGSDQQEDFKSERKYTHTLRRTSSGWKFASLMSNNNL